MRVLLVEDYSVIRLGLRNLVELEDGMEVVGEAERADVALELARETKPDLAILDLKLKGGGSGIELCRELKSLPDPPRVLVYTAFNSPEEVSSALVSGADGYVHKGVHYERLVDAMQKTSRGESVWLLGEDEEAAAATLQSAAKKSLLSPREKEVLVLVARRYTNKEVSGELYISLQTTKNHVSSILRKLDKKSRRDLFR